ncbi:MAG: ATP-binding cassette domain-containing protein [Chloroflexota bacterium]|nr:MAG: ATP-binding cassette domain-containing protein [Chloroflexota bacterium]
MEPGAPALDVQHVTVAYADGQRLGLDGVSLLVGAGEHVALVGSNGAGKSTLLKAVAGLLPVVSGTIAIYGHPVGACHHRVAYLAQRGEVDWRFPITVADFVMTGRYVHLGWFRRPGQGDRSAAATAIDRLGLTPLAERQIGDLSGGQQQRVLLARALAQDADLLLLDEPLNAVDADTRAVVASVMDDLRSRGKTVIVATHDVGRGETPFNQILYLAEGRAIAPPVDRARSFHQ